MASRAREIKVVLLGDTGVGKSSIVRRFVTDDYVPFVEATVGYGGRAFAFSSRFACVAAHAYARLAGAVRRSCPRLYPWMASQCDSTSGTLRDKRISACACPLSRWRARARNVSKVVW